jgi:hypothetical protein
MSSRTACRYDQSVENTRVPSKRERDLVEFYSEAANFDLTIGPSSKYDVSIVSKAA